MNTILVADIGGTNTTLALAKNDSLQEQQHFDTQKIKDFSKTINDYLTQKNVKVRAVVIAVAGPIIKKNNYSHVQLTNAKLVIDEQTIIKNTSLKKVFLLNDLEALGYATNILSKDQKKFFRKRKTTGEHALLFAVGTGLGKTFLLNNNEQYTPVASEFCETDLPIYSQKELLLKDFLKKKHKKKIVCYEDVLSGRGLSSIYEYYSGKTLTAQMVMQERSVAAKKTKKTFSTFLGRACKNEILNNLASGSLFLGGGVINKNPDLINKDFEQELRHENKEYQAIIDKTPIIILTDYAATLSGCQAYARQNKLL